MIGGRRRFVLALAVAASTLLACGSDTTAPTPTPPSPFHALSTKAAVLNNIEVAYNQRNISQYEKLLDPDFTFHLSAGDVNNGLPSQWGRAEEVLVNTRMFDPNYDGSPLVLKIQMNFSGFDPANPGWQAFVPDNHPDEQWYKVTVFYSFEFDVVEPDDPNHHFLSPSSAKVQFTVRNIGTADKPQYRLVDMLDLGANNRLAGDAPAGTEQSTWGAVKSLYR